MNVKSMLPLSWIATLRLTNGRPADGAHVVPGEHPNLAGVHGGAFEPAVLAAFQNQEHLALPQFQLILLTGSIGKHGHIPGTTTEDMRNANQ